MSAPAKNSQPDSAPQSGDAALRADLADMADLRSAHRSAETADLFLAGTGELMPTTAVLDPDPTCSHPFPLGEGTGEQVRSAFGTPPESPVPGLGNRWGTGTGQVATGQVPSNLDTSSTSIAHTLRGAGRRPVPAQQIKQQALAPQSSSSWSAVDLVEVVNGLRHGTLDQPRPIVGDWLYAGAVNGLAGESGCGKTWTALTSAMVEMMAGERVVYIDLEDSAVGIVGRLRALGVPDDVIVEQFRYVRPDEAFRDDVRNDLWHLLDTVQPSLIVLDSTGESMALEGVDPNSDDGVAGWFQRVARPIADRGPAVLLLDHLPKSDSSAASPIGSQRKRAAISGVQMIQSVAKGMSFAKGRQGLAKLTCTKDRHGNFVTGEAVLQLIVRPEPARGDAGVSASLASMDDQADFAPTRHMADITAWLAAQSSPQSTAAIKKAVRGKAETISTALAVLESSGYVSSAPGPRNSTEYTLTKEYALGDDYEVPGADSLCEHEWHEGSSKCNSEWCHDGHFGSCNA